MRAARLLLGAFFVAATILLLVSAASLAWQGTNLDAIWAVAPDKLAVLAPHGPMVAIGFALLAVVMAVAATGVFRRREWARKLAIVIFAVNGAGDAAEAVTGQPVAFIGVAVSGAIVLWLLQSAVRREFDAPA
jgi:hypothetical protein